ncbi:hypothetical protein [Endothiovibrio diazotrophicus]
MNGLHQLNLRYESAEDRLLLLIRTSEGNEIRVWLTRRFTRLLQQVLDSAVERMVDQVLAGRSPSPVAAAPASPATVELPVTAPLDRERVKAFQREHARSTVNLSSEYVAKAVGYPMGEVPLLASRIESRLLDGDALSLTFAVGEQQGINLALDRDHLFAFVDMVDQGAVVAEWGLPVRQQAEGRAAAAGVVH